MVNELAVKRLSEEEMEILKSTVKNLTNGSIDIKMIIASGGFGYVFRAVNRMTKAELAVKILKTTNQRRATDLGWEAHILKRLQGKERVPTFFCCSQAYPFPFMVTELLGPNLYDYTKAISCARDAGMTAKIGLQCLLAIKVLHSAGFVHRDIKPHNFAISLKKKHQICIIDFGMAKRYRKEGVMLPPRKTAGFRGTIRYVSVAVHEEKEQGRVDDLISLFYVLTEILIKRLPWRKKNMTETHLSKLRHEMGSLVENYCEELVLIANELQNLGYYSEPDYELWEIIMNDIMRKYNIGKMSPFIVTNKHWSQ